MSATVVTSMSSGAFGVWRLRGRIAVLIASFSLTVAGGVCADPEVKRSQAEARFQEGLELLEAKRFPEACSAFEQSLALERAIGTLLNLGRCYEATRRPASAYSVYQAALEEAEKAGDAQRAKLALTRRDEADQHAPRVQLVLPPDTAGFTILLDGRALAADPSGKPIRVDPGTRKLAFAEGNDIQQAFAIEVFEPVAATQQVQIVSVILMRDRHPLSVSKQLSSSQPSQDEAKSQPLTSPVPTGTIRKPRQPLNARDTRLEVSFAWGGMIAGASGLSSGVALGIDAFVDAEAADCDQTLTCSQSGVIQRRRAKEQLEVAYAIAIAGGALVVASTLVLALTSPSSSEHRKQELKASAQVHSGGIRVGVVYAF